MDLLTALENIPTSTYPDYFTQQRGTWTQAKLKTFLDRNCPKYRSVEKADRDDAVQYNLAVCPLCGHSEGNPAVWLQDGHPMFHCFWGGPGCADPPQKTFADLEAHFPKLARISAFDLPAKYPQERRNVIKGILRHGDVANFVGGPKTRKSFLVMQLALSVASGTPFLCWPTIQHRVLLVDNELRPDDLARRMTAMAQAMGLDFANVAKQIDIMPLRGLLADVNTIRDELCTIPGTYGLVIVDALYKAMPRDSEENSNSDMTRAYVVLDAIAETHDCGMAVVHHTSKGSQAGKSVSDIGAGAGAQSRSADAHIVLLPHDDDDTIVLDAILRSLPPIEPFCLTFDYPLWRLAPDKDPERVAEKQTVTLEDFLEVIPAEPSRKTEVLAHAKEVLGVSERRLAALLHEATLAHRLIVTEPANKTKPHLIHRMEKKLAA
jgi:hypothetical protein